MDLFEEKRIKPMLIGASGQAFESDGYIYEIKFDGERAIAYLDKAGTELRNKRNRIMNGVFPELAEIHKQVSGRCIIDGEYICLVDGKPNFSAVQRRSLLGNPFKIKMATETVPVSFIAFDILYLDGQDLTGKPLMTRKHLLQEIVRPSDRIAYSPLSYMVTSIIPYFFRVFNFFNSFCCFDIIAFHFILLFCPRNLRGG